jgi:hypothetical protein
VLSYVPKEFVQLVKPFFDHTAMIEVFWKIIFLDIRSISSIIDQEIIIDTAIDAFKNYR